MKISVNWLKQFTAIDLPLEELVEKIGAQLGAVEEVTDIGKKYQGVVVAKVVSCEKHQNADKLSVCLIDDGGKTQRVERTEQGYVQVVCGAPNVRNDLMVAWLPPGSTVPSSYGKDPFVLEARELRGVISNGMLASASELAISDDHNGIVELELDVAPGTDFADAYQLNDYIIDIENKMFTHRPDCFGLLGVAREIAGIQHKQFTSPDWYLRALDRVKPGKSKLPLTVINNAPDLVPRFMAIALADTNVRQSPFLLQTYLSRVGLRPINNIVDITNYVMFLTGQPLHAYDADKLQQYGNLSLETRMSRPGDRVKLLTGKEIEFQDESTVLITSNDVPVGVAGVMGGADTEVDEKTKNIVLECATFDMYNIRRTSMKHGLFTDAVTRFNKGQSPRQNERVLEEAVALVRSLTGAHVASEVFDEKASADEINPVTVSPDFINDRLGSDLTANDMSRLMTNVEFTVELHGETMHITPPFWRTDIDIAEDIVEEVGRLYGYDNLSLETPLRDITPVLPNSDLDFNRQLREVLSRAGANEVLTYSFVHSDVIKKAGQDISQAFTLSNALSPDLQHYRLSLTPSLLDKVHANIKAGFNQFAIFELGKAHQKSVMDTRETTLPAEKDLLSFVFSADEKTATHKYEGSPYYAARMYLSYLEECLGVRFSLKPLREVGADAQPTALPFESTQSAAVLFDETVIGYIGTYATSVRKNFKLPLYTAGFELQLDSLKRLPYNSPYTALSRYPKVEQDITLRVPATTQYASVISELQKAVKIPDSIVKLTPTSIFQSEKAPGYRNVTVRLAITSLVRTLTTEEVNRALNQASEVLADTLHAERV